MQQNTLMEAVKSFIPIVHCRAQVALGEKEKKKSGHRTLTCAIVKWVPICPFEAY